ncbi:hypothetical protein [Candidatus Odyssella thessalonicensis]|uniref:hypothetical protein n=1 Tax=Candidatus Odyssella thessalonicensis TaxID=84647 RepID=UPI000225B951|nr:hypothetical protein [Candidatus Odyssella thessalonicensis]
MYLTSSIALVGPICAGKTTLSQVIGDFFSLPVVHTDAHKGQYFLESGFNEEHAEDILKEEGIEAYYSYLKGFEYDYIVNNLVLPSSPSIYDFGAGFVCFDEVFKKLEVIKFLEKFDNVFLILPHKDQEKSYQLIYNRLIERSKTDKELFNYIIGKNFDLIEYFLQKFQDLSCHTKMEKIFTSYSLRHTLKNIITHLIEAKGVIL